MTDLFSMVNGLKRPKLLTRAARIGLQDYRRGPALKRLLGYNHPTGTAPLVMALMELEGDVNAQRIEGAATYSPQEHVEVMIALIAEAQKLRAA